MRKLLCKILTRGKHLFRLREHRYRCLFCKALRYQVDKKIVVIKDPGNISFAYQPTNVKISLVDTGTGLPPAAVEKYTNDEPAEQN
jgi:hypothetical protein